MTVRVSKSLVPLFAGVAGLLCTLPIATWLFKADTNAAFFTNRDFANYWIASRLTLGGQALDLFRGHDVYFPHLQAAFGQDYPWHSWSYPPHYLFFILPLGLMPYLPSAVVFEIVTLTLFLHAVSLLARRIDGRAALLLLPAIVCNLIAVQNGFLTSALMLYGLALRERRPLLAGLAIGLLTIKPQLGLLLPVLLIFERRWTAILAAAAAATAAIGLSALVFGAEAWTGYIGITWPYQILVMREIVGLFPHMMPSVFGAARSLGLDAHMAGLLHYPVAALAFAVFLWSLFRLRAPLGRSASLLFATFIITPYSVVYDMPMLAAGAALIATAESRAMRGDGKDRGLVFPVLACIAPLLGFALSLHSLPVAPLLLAAGWAALLLRERATAAVIPGCTPTA